MAAAGEVRARGRCHGYDAHLHPHRDPTCVFVCEFARAFVYLPECMLAYVTACLSIRISESLSVYHDELGSNKVHFPQSDEQKTRVR